MTTMKWKMAASVVVAVLTATGAAGQGSVATDREALEAFYYAASGPNWTNNDGWLEESAWGSWYGVTIIIGEPVGSGRVWDLRLRGNNLSGPIVADLSRLHYLRRLRLSENSLSGRIPPELGQLGNLESLWLYGNNLSGPIPAELGQIDGLRQLHLSDNNLSGPIPVELGRIAALSTLQLQHNNLSGPIPSELGGGRLLALNLADNSLSGPIPPELGHGRLDYLWLSNNNLSGPIPAELGQLSGLQELRLDGNNLSGPIPAELGQLSSIQRLTIDATTGLCLPADFPADSRFATLARDQGVPDCDAGVPTLPARLTLSAAVAPAEGGPEVTVTAMLDAPAPADGTTVTLTTGGTATLDTDYTLSSTTIIIAEGETAGSAVITVIDDTEVDDGETIVLDAESANPPLTAPTLTLTIEDNDVPVPALPVGGALLLGALLLWRGAVRARNRSDR